MLAMSLIVIFANVCMVIGAQNASPSFVTSLTYIGVVWGLVYDYFIFNQVLSDVQIIASLMIIGLNLMTIYCKLNSSQKQDN